MSSGISILICTYNGAKKLPETLRHIAEQEVTISLRWEIIVVDNNSSDDTAEVAKKFWYGKKCDVHFSVVKEHRPGKSYALETGIANASYDLLLICDDDNWLQKNYVQYAYDFMLTNPSAGVLGAQAIPFTETPKPFWFDKYENVFAVGKQLRVTGLANERKFIFGAGMIIRKKIYTTVSNLNHQLFLTCRKGNELSSGGDSEICLLAMQLGYDLYYDEQLRFTHYISPNRLQWFYCVEMMTKGFAYPQIYFAMYDYCFNAVKKNEQVNFEDLYRWNMRKQQRILFSEFKGLTKFFSGLVSLLHSKPGNGKEIQVKTAINKLKYMKKNKQQLAKDFETILAFAKRIKQVNTTSFTVHN